MADPMPDTPTDRPRTTRESAHVVAWLVGKAFVIAIAIVVLMVLWRFSVAEMALVGTTAWAAAMMMGLSEYDAIAASEAEKWP